MAFYKPTKWMVVLSVVGSGVGAAVFFRDYLGGKKYDGKEDLSGKTVIITGANSGIGFETAKELARRNARVIMACRNKELCQQARKEIVLETKNNQVLCRFCDLASFASIRDFAARILQEESQVNVLINNAGVMRCPQSQTVDGFEMQFGVNHLGHFLLTNLLLDKLKASAPSRIVNVSSLGHVAGKMNFDDLNYSVRSYDSGGAYYQSKLANILFTKELAKKLHGTGVTVYALHPGLVDTNIARHMGIFNSTFSSIFAKPILRLFVKTPGQGAQTVIYCSISDEVKDQSGLYYSDCAIKEPSKAALNEEDAARLWAISEHWTTVR